jgi:hypothetical protein
MLYLSTFKRRDSDHIVYLELVLHYITAIDSVEHFLPQHLHHTTFEVASQNKLSRPAPRYRLKPYRTVQPP